MLKPIKEKEGQLTVSGGIIGAGYDDNLLVSAGHGLHLAIKWSARGAHQ